MSEHVSDASPSSLVMPRVIALSSTIASGALFLFFLDHFFFGKFDPGYLIAWTYILASGASDAVKQGPAILWSVWVGLWLLTGLDSIRSPGSRRVAVASVAVLMGGVILTLMISHVARNFMLRGVGSQ